MFRIEICGGIATGKTTLATELAAVGNIDLVLEKFEEVPFWKKFYENPPLYAFSKNVSFQLFHADCLRDAEGSRYGAVCDFAFLQDMSYAAIPPSREEELPLLWRIHRHLAKSFSPPAAIVHLSCSTATQLERIRRRGRPAEQSIDALYLDNLNMQIAADVGIMVNNGADTPLIVPRSTDAIKLVDYRSLAEEICAKVREGFAASASSSRP